MKRRFSHLSFSDPTDGTVDARDVRRQASLELHRVQMPPTAFFGMVVN
jgi:hypothetical protein